MDDITDPQYRTPDGSALRMWRDTLPNNFLTEKLGRPLFDEVILVEVISPGSMGSTPVFELVRFPSSAADSQEPQYSAKYKEYEQFVNDFIKNAEIDASLSGTPLKEWSELTRARVAELRAGGIHTVDALAAVSDGRLHVIGNDGRALREKAIAYLENSKNSAYSTALAAELQVERENNKALAEQVKELASKIGELENRDASDGGQQAALDAANAKIAELQADIAKMDGDKNGKVGGKAKTTDPLAATPPASII